jgi:hypothetical protein
MNAELKTILLELVSEVEDLRANQVLLVGLSLGPMTVGGALKAKGLALKTGSANFDTLRTRIEGLA